MSERAVVIAVANKPGPVCSDGQEVGVHFAFDPGRLPSPRLHAKQLPPHRDLANLDLNAHLQGRSEVGRDDHDLAVDRAVRCPFQDEDPVAGQVERNQPTPV